MILNHPQNRLQIKLWIFQKTHQQLQRTVPRPPANTKQRAIQQISTLANALNRVGKSKLLIVMAVHPDAFARQMLLK